MVEKGAEERCDPNGRDCPATSSELAAQRTEGRGHRGTQPAQGPSTQRRTNVTGRGQRAEGPLGHPSGPPPALCLQFRGQDGEVLPKAPTPPTCHQGGRASVGRAGVPGAMSPPCPAVSEALLQTRTPEDHTPGPHRTSGSCVCHIKPFRIPGTLVLLLPACRRLTGSSGVQIPLGNSASSLHREHRVGSAQQ